ncbi:MAG: SDR family NAD(P)-dependent oxidoreductase [Deltaproteobacteria bacterium]|nr:SDR family NAD(P)-dependent oxidoreductase [Deltaproteobacteria bacterium]
MTSTPASPRPRQALITGASSGIGAAVARLLANDGYEVHLAARRRELLESEVHAIEAAGGKAHAVVLDVTDADRTARQVVALDEACGGLDLVIANAGVSATVRPHKLDWPTAEHALRVNFMGAAATLLPLVPRMLARRRGHLVAISSVAAEIPLPVGAVYGASKAGLSHLLLALGPALRAGGVQATVVHPGFVRTPLTAGARFPMPFILDVEVAARIICRGIARQRAWVRFPWPMAVLLRLVRVVPRPVREWFVRRWRL